MNSLRRHALSGAFVPEYISPDAGIAQLVEHNLAKVGVAGSSPVSRSRYCTVRIEGSRKMCGGRASAPPFLFDGAEVMHGTTLPGWRNR